MRSTLTSNRVALRLALAAIAGTAMLAPLPSVVSAQAPALPQIRLVSDIQFSSESSNMYLCSGADWEKCKNSMDVKIEDMFYSYPERDNLGGAQVREGQTIDLGGVPAFVLYVRYSGFQGPSWEAYQVKVTLEPAPVTSPFTGTVQAEGAWASVNGLKVTQGEPIFGIVTSPAVVDFELRYLDSTTPQPGAPGVVLSVTSYRRGGRFGPRRP